MPHSKSSKKDLIRIRIRNARNRAFRARLRTFIKKARTGITAAPATEGTVTDVRAACRELDRMVTKGIIHKNQAARKKSRLMVARKKAETAAV